MIQSRNSAGVNDLIKKQECIVFRIRYVTR